MTWRNFFFWLSRNSGSVRPVKQLSNMMWPKWDTNEEGLWTTNSHCQYISSSQGRHCASLPCQPSNTHALVHHDSRYVHSWHSYNQLLHQLTNQGVLKFLEKQLLGQSAGVAHRNVVRFLHKQNRVVEYWVVLRIFLTRCAEKCWETVCHAVISSTCKLQSKYVIED